jgi:hypothetical protein
VKGFGAIAKSDLFCSSRFTDSGFWQMKLNSEAELFTFREKSALESHSTTNYFPFSMTNTVFTDINGSKTDLKLAYY